MKKVKDAKNSGTMINPNKAKIKFSLKLITKSKVIRNVAAKVMNEKKNANER